MFLTVGDIDLIDFRERIDANKARFNSSGTMEEAGLVMNAMDISAAELTWMVIYLKAEGANRFKKGILEGGDWHEAGFLYSNSSLEISRWWLQTQV